MADPQQLANAYARTTDLRSARGRMTLANIIVGRIEKPLRLLLYGVDGIGKTTLAAGSESPIFIGVEDGTATLDVPRFPEPSTWFEVLAACDELACVDHAYRTVVIDTLDWLEPLCWSHVIAGKRDKQGKPIENIEGIGYGKGYSAALDEWRVLLSKLDRLRASRGMQVILIAHTWIKSFKNPEGEDFDRFEIKLHAKAAGLLREWADAVLFATHETYTHENDNGRVKGISTGARIMWTERKAAFDAKNRYSLPEMLPLDWQSLTDAIRAGQPADPDVLMARIKAQLEAASVPVPMRVRVEEAIARASGDGGELARIANKLSAQLNITQQEAGK